MRFRGSLYVRAYVVPVPRLLSTLSHTAFNPWQFLVIQHKGTKVGGAIYLKGKTIVIHTPSAAPFKLAQTTTATIITHL